MQAFLIFCAAMQMLVDAQAGQYFIVAPNVVRVDVQETILVNVFGTGVNVIPVTLFFQLAGSNDRISETAVDVTEGEPQEARLRIRRDQLPQRQTSGQQFVTLVASANTAQLSINDRRSILLSYQAGFVFIQTDKPLYTPEQRVDIRIVALDQDMAPANNEIQVDIISPDSIIVERYKQRPDNGFLTLTFVFPSNPVFGNWSVGAYYGHQFKASSTVQFEAKEYVLPKFYVEVAPQSMYIVPETQNLISKVTARYIFGEPVVGNFYVKYGVLVDDGTLTELQSKEGRLDEDGVAFQDLDMNAVAVENWVDTLMGKRLVIQAFVTDTATGETINANNTQVTFSTTPYKFNWYLTQRYFKKGLAFSVKANVQFMSGLPAENVAVIASASALLSDGTREVLELGAQAGGNQNELEKRSGPQGEVDFRLDLRPTATEMTINLRTNNLALVNANTQDSIRVPAQVSTNGEYLVVRVPSGDIRQVQELGMQSNVEVQLTHHNNVGILNYFVIAGGRIVHKGVKKQVNSNTGLGFEISHEMAPSSRVVAYYIKADGNVIADSLLIDVQEKCKNPIGLSFLGLDSEGGTYMSSRSGQNVELEVLAKAGTRVGLVAVDEAVFKLRNYHRLTQKKVFKRMAGYDLGCGPGGGQTSGTIFKNAGVTVMANAQLSVPPRNALGCPEQVRRARRSANDTEREQILSTYEDVDEREFCEMGLRELTGSVELTCAQRSRLMARRKRLREDSTKIAAFYDCCRRLENSNLGRANAGGDDGVNLDDIMVRSNFPESWLFDDFTTQPLADNEEDEDDGRVLHRTTLPDSVTTWVIEAVGVRGVHEMCVAEPIKLEVRPPFFLDIGMPYSVQRFEQIEIVASVFNYGDRDLDVTVYLSGKEGLCSIAQPGEYSEGMDIRVEANRPGSVKFVIVPLEVGTVPIEIAAVDARGEFRDAIVKNLNVRPEGYEKTMSVPVTLDPANYRSLENSQNGGPNQFYLHTQKWGDEGEEKQIDIIRYSVNRNAIPGSYTARMSLMGNVIGSVINTVIGGLDKLLRIPGGCGEQTMLGLAPNVYVYSYLKHSSQFTADLETTSAQYISAGVQHELTFRKHDGSFTVWPTLPSSTWLTAFVAKVFYRAKEFAFVDDATICKALEWLITQTQTEDGSYSELYKVYHREMTGGVQGKVSLTAYVLISVLECECNTINKDASVAAAIVFLETQLGGLTRPYAIAITAYALALANSNNAQDAIDMLKEISTYNEGSNYRYWAADDSSFGGGQKPYWYSVRPKAIEVETTGLAVLALLQMDDIPYTHAAVNWLANQENYNGGFASTQDTVIALQALSEYAYRVQQYDLDFNCKVKCEESDFDEAFALNPANALVREQRNIGVPDKSQEMNVFINTEGAGMGQFKFEATYYIPEPDLSECDFELLINEDEDLQLDQPENNDKEYLPYNIQVRYLRGDRTGMAILDVGLYTGYKAVVEDLENVKENSGGLVERYEVTDHTVVFYFDEITGAEAIRIQFRAEREFNVGKVQPVAVHVYDYYNPTEECVKFISPKKGSNMLGKLCVGDTCVCAAGKCGKVPITKSSEYDVFEMTTAACASQEHFAYEVHVTDVEEKGNFQFYTMTIDAPLKQGLDDVLQGATRVFAKSKSCDTPEFEMNGKKYLVIGSGGLQTKDDMGQDTFKYIIDDRVSFYEYPTAKQLEKNKWKRINGKLMDLKRELVNGEGCAL